MFISNKQKLQERTKRNLEMSQTLISDTGSV